MEDIFEQLSNNPEACREEGKRLYFDAERTAEEHSLGFRLLDNAVKLYDPEARYIFGRLLVEKRLSVTEGDSVEHGLYLLCYAANHGFAPARAFLNKYCNDDYAANVGSRLAKTALTDKPLTGFDGKKIRLKKSGIMTPIDAKLEFIDGVNVLTLSANIEFYVDESEVSDPKKFYNAIFEGFKDWAGDYEVFGGQKLKVVVELTTEDRLFDNVIVIPMTRELNSQVVDIWNKFGTEKIKKRVDNTIGSKRSMAAFGVRKWSVKSRKIIFIQSENDRFDDYDEIRHVAKHEFGHALGLGDLYKSAVDGLEGVDKGSYKEMDSYYITDNFYNLVMCDHHGIISNNDIEMVVLAFSQNRLQKYQPSKLKGKISQALGRGN
ncbi:MAG: hypothetical protein ACI396_05635 [Acutalibacteraceae bacterium]